MPPPSSKDPVIVPMTEVMVDQVVKLHLSAFEGYMNARLGPAYLRALMRWFVQNEHSIALAVIDGNQQIIGYAVGTSLDSEGEMTRHLFWIAFLATLVRPSILFSGQFRKTIRTRLSLLLRRHPSQHTYPELPTPVMSLTGIAVSPSARGTNISSHLMEAFVTRARALQMRSLLLSVYPHNTPARRLYERCGLQALPSPSTKTSAMHYFSILEPYSQGK